MGAACRGASKDVEYPPATMLGDAGKVDVMKDWSGSLVASTTALVGERGDAMKASQL